MSCEDEHYNGHSHGHNHDSNDDGDHHGHSHIAPIPTNQSQSLQSKIDTPHVTALNLQNPNDELPKLFKSHEDKYQLKPIFKSDCDSQVIINIPFVNSQVKLFSIILRTNGDKYCPKTIKLWKNDKSIDFDNVESKKATFVINHPRHGVNYNDEPMPSVLDSDDEFIEHYLPRHIFTGVHHLTLFIENIYDEDDEDESQFHYIDLRGEATDLSKDPVISIYEASANPADHKNLMVQESSGFSIGN